MTKSQTATREQREAREERPTGAELIALFQADGDRNPARTMDAAYELIAAALPELPAAVLVDHAAHMIRAARRAAHYDNSSATHTGAELIHAALEATAPDAAALPAPATTTATTATTAAHPLDELSNRAAHLLNRTLDYIREYRAAMSA